MGEEKEMKETKKEMQEEIKEEMKEKTRKDIHEERHDHFQFPTLTLLLLFHSPLR